jgi:hypothetical protein
VLTTAEIGATVIDAIQRARRELTEGAIVSLDSTRSRVHILPLEPRHE